MNRYPTWWNTTLTIFNRFEDKQTQLIRWYKFTVPNCFWKYVGDKIAINEAIIETNNIICRIPKDEAFLEKYKWIAKPNDEKDNFFTLGVGDIIINGEVTEDIDEYKSGSRSSDILAKYKQLQGCMTIEEVGINIDGGRCNEHYFVKGI